jgi:hypothetical protein
MATIFEEFVAYHTSGVQLNSTPRDVHMQRVAVMAKPPQKVVNLGRAIDFPYPLPHILLPIPISVVRTFRRASMLHQECNMEFVRRLHRKYATPIQMPGQKIFSIVNKGNSQDDSSILIAKGLGYQLGIPSTSTWIDELRNPRQQNVTLACHRLQVFFFRQPLVSPNIDLRSITNTPDKTLP